jgi:PAS domain S-box-containing protein
VSEPVKILIAEDLEADFELARREIRRELPSSEFLRVETGPEFLAALFSFEPHLVISDYRMPRFDGLTALKLTLKHASCTPVIILTSASNEDIAVECMKAGAADYVIKEHLKRLGRAVLRALEERAERVERAKVEEALRESDTRLRELASNLDPVLFVLDFEGPEPCITYASPSRDRIFGAGRAPHTPAEWLAAVHPDDRGEAEEFLRRTVFGDGGAAETQHRITLPDGAVRWIRVKHTPIRAGDGHLRRVAGFAEDITARKEAEAGRAKLEAQLIQAQKMESVGRLAGGVAHDFNNMICVIMGYSQLILGRLQQNDPLSREIQEIEKAAGRARDITAQLLAFSRKQVIAPKVIDLNEHIAGTKRTLMRLVGEDIELDFRPGPDLWRIKFDASQLDQVLVNLAANARDAMPKGGRLAIATSNVPAGSPYSQRHAALAGRDCVLLSIADDGEGISEEVRAHIFEPFYTTKAAGKGTGLGLATVYGIVQQSEGAIDVESAPGHGATFRFLIPRHAGEAVAPPDRPDAPPARGQGAMLLVEDDAMVRKMTATMLKSMGYAVSAAATPEEALALAGARRFDLVLTDVVMPGMSGPDLLDRLHSTQPEVRVLYMSGYAPEAITRRGVLQEGDNFLQKPFSAAELNRKVREAMGISEKAPGTSA